MPSQRKAEENARNDTDPLPASCLFTGDTSCETLLLTLASTNRHLYAENQREACDRCRIRKGRDDSQPTDPRQDGGTLRDIAPSCLIVCLSRSRLCLNWRLTSHHFLFPCSVPLALSSVARTLASRCLLVALRKSKMATKAAIFQL